MVYWKRYYRLGSHTRQLRFDNPDGFFRGQPPRGSRSLAVTDALEVARKQGVVLS